MNNIQEKQSFSNKWIWTILLLVLCINTFVVVRHFNTVGSIGLLDLLPFLITVVLTLLFLNFRLEFSINNEGVSYRFFPIHNKMREIKRSEIVKITAIEYSPLLEYGGWGIRRGKTGWAYTISGNKGIFIQLANGKSVLLGTKQSIEQLNEKLNLLAQSEA